MSRDGGTCRLGVEYVVYRCSQERLTLLKDVARKVGEGSPYREAAPPLGARFNVPVG